MTIFVRVICCLAVGWVVAGCGGDGSSPTSDGEGPGSLSPHDGANAVVTDESHEAATRRVVDTAMALFTTVMSAADVEKPALSTIDSVEGEYAGNHGGHAVVDGSVVTTTNGNLVELVEFEFTALCHDYADTDTLWVGGSLEYGGTIDITNTWNPVTTILIEGDVRFNGKYRGAQVFEAQVVTNNSGVGHTVTVSTSSGGAELTETFTY